MMGVSWYRSNSKAYRWLHYIYCHLCRHRDSCNEWHRWRRRELSIVRGNYRVKTLFDVVVVGAGPAGSTTALHAAAGGAETLLIEEHSAVGLPPHCAGIVGNKNFEKADLRVPVDLVQAGVHKVNVHYSNYFLKLESRSGFTVLDRPRFDAFLANLAVEKGVDHHNL